ncbi:MAG: site-specific DNA-methyltransferase [Deltaproteobacteria bacterium CG07_land_8_20_14_0_80_38_7]|nr:MAG: site-specific DNA-methyltransferase [Deltaproteobacteria bacterium CG07_land_8_20_14_0_80_38_7]
MITKLEKLKEKLKELFQLDQADLDFGIYRILNAKHGEIVKFLDDGLLIQVKTSLNELGSDNTSLKKELDEAMRQAEKLGADPDTLPKVVELKKRLKETPDISKYEDDIYSHLYNFFSRYYKDGDFMSMRRYKEGVYAIPYEGEEVKLHWANSDQYYIKSSEYLRNYAFKVAEEKKVNFKIVEADIEADNKKTESGKERKFILSTEKPFYEENDELYINFEYRPDDSGKKQKSLNEESVVNILNAKKLGVDWKTELAATRPTVTNKKRTLLEKHLSDFTARFTFDYFIHKDLGGFLRRELDFYIKNEVMHLDDIESESTQKVDQYLLKIKVIRKISHKLIDFMAQLENFQKKLWLKKKFVVETNYCITLDRVPEKLYTEIIKNQAQHDEWVRLFAIDEIKGTDGDLLKSGGPAYSKKLTVEFLKHNSKLVLDTRYFDEEFKGKLFRSMENVDEQCDGLLINADNSDGLRLIETTFIKSVECVCIDPPYNTGSDGFCYKDGFRSSSWLSQQAQLIPNARRLLVDDGSFFTFNDENEIRDYSLLLETYFGKENFVETIIWNKRIPKNDKGIGNIHDFILLLSNNLALRRQRNKLYTMRKDELEDIYELIRRMKDKGISIADTQLELKKFYRKQGYDRGITLYCELDSNYRVWGKINMSWPNAKTVGPRYEVINPVTGKPVPIPEKGWRWKEDTFRASENDGPEHLLHDGSMMKGRVWYSSKETVQPSSITYLDEVESFLLRSILSVKSDGSLALEKLGLADLFDYPKSVLLIERLLHSIGEQNGTILDYFAGSGTTGQAVLNLNREDQGKRKYILVEMGAYFDTVLRSRIEKVTYAPSGCWGAGKPSERNQGISHCFKYLHLESYEDCLNNLTLAKAKDQALLLESQPALKEDYYLRYMLDVETKGSLLNVSMFTDPFNYKMLINTGTAGEMKETKIDLIETFNYLIGLHVKHIDDIRGIRIIDGTNRDGERILVLWRNTKEIENNKLNEWFTKQGYNTQDMEYDIIYVNGDNNLENLKKDEHTWKVRLIEEEFNRLMFEGCEA